MERPSDKLGDHHHHHHQYFTLKISKKVDEKWILTVKTLINSNHTDKHLLNNYYVWDPQSISCGNLTLRQKLPWWFDVSGNNLCMAVPTTGWIPVAQDVKGCVNTEITGSKRTSLVSTLLRSSARATYWVSVFHCKIFLIISNRNCICLFFIVVLN